mmetsp:Transcript_21748/g.29163  ORF Transcript_21748/g.29163 Transcript_21748/m.29163 type:complete len:175 (-) Transcript_21748:1062-1586(-)
MSGKTLQFFKIATRVVSFDYFQPFEFIDADLTYFGAWSLNFAWLGHEDTNFLLSLGSIIIFAAIVVLQILCALTLSPCKCQRRCKWIKRRCSGEKACFTILTFINGTYYEIFVSLSTSLIVIQYWPYMTQADKFSVYLTFVFTAIITVYTYFVFYFALFRSRQIALVEHASIME